MGSVSHQITIGKAIVMHITVCELLLILIDFVKLRSHMGIGSSSADLATKDVSTLSGCSWLSGTTDRVGATHISILDLSNHLHLVRVIHDEFLAIYGVSPIY